MGNENELVIQYVDPSTLVFRENVRWRADSNLSELMESIKQNGIQQPVKARKEDRTIVFGHRRIGAAIKLGLKEVPVIFDGGISDKQANILNLLENMQRKDVTSLEIGRQCDIMLKNTKFKLSINELSTILGVSSTRIKICLDAFKRLPPEYRDKVVHVVNNNRKYGQLPENVVYAILNFNREFKKLDAKELKICLNTAASEKLTVGQIRLIGRLMNSGMLFKKALKEIKLYTIMRMDIPVLKTELSSAMRKENMHTKIEFCIKIFNKVYPNLVV